MTNFFVVYDSLVIMLVTRETRRFENSLTRFDISFLSAAALLFIFFSLYDVEFFVGRRFELCHLSGSTIQTCDGTLWTFLRLLVRPSLDGLNRWQ
jgi:hypothetical protein